MSASSRPASTSDAQNLLRSFVSRVQTLEEEKKTIGQDIKVVYAEAKAAGFDTKIMRKSIRALAIDANQRGEEQLLFDTYMHALGDRADVPLFKAVGALSVDTAMRGQVIEACKLFVPAHGEIVLRTGEISVRLWRDGEGEVHAEDVRAENPTHEEKTMEEEPEKKEAVIDVDAASPAEAKELGERAARGTGSLADNPYDVNDSRHRIWADAWTAEIKRLVRRGPK